MKNLVIILIALSVLTIKAQTPVVEAVDSTFSIVKPIISDLKFSPQIDSARLLVDSLMISWKIPGLAIAVGLKNRVVWAEGFGFADLENYVPVSVDTKFRVGSVSKVYTAIGLMKLYESGKIDLDAQVQKYVPKFPLKKYMITPRQLASHSAGIRHYNYRIDNEFLSRKRYNNINDALEIFKYDTLLFEPGTKTEYTSYGYNLLSAVIEGASGTNFLSYMKNEVFIPLDMTSTLADHLDTIVSHRARPYSYNKDTTKLVNSYYVDNSNKWAGGGFLSNPVDMVRLCNHIGNTNYLKPETRRLMFTKFKLNNGGSSSYGIGWALGEYNGSKVALHSGTSVGGRSYLVYFYEQKLAIAVTVNIRADYEKEFLYKIADLFFPLLN